MCGRFNLRTPASQLAAFFDIVFDPPLQTSLAPRFNIAPSQPVLVVRRAAAADRTPGALGNWGLVPSWAKDPSIGNRMINARGETVAEKPSFRSAFRHRRCLVPASGFYEWQKMTGSRKQPWHIHRPDDAPLAFAGIWEHWEAEDGSVLQTCAIITTDANSQMAPIHHRMPVILDPDVWDIWLDPALEKPSDVLPLLGPCTDEHIEAYPVSRYVNSPRNDDAKCIEPDEAEESQSLF